MAIDTLHLGERAHAARIVGQRSIWSTLYSPGIYVTVALALLASTLLVQNNLAFAGENRLVVMVRPLFLPVFVSTVLVSLYLALGATLSMARERDRGTLQVLFFGPVDAWAYLWGRLWSQTVLFILAALVSLLCAAALAAVTNLVLHWDLPLVLLLALATNGAVVALGLLMAAWGRSSRTALILFVVIVLVALVIQFGDQAILQLAAQVRPNRQDPLLFLRQVLAALNQGLQWLSPYAQLSRAMDALVIGNGARLLLHLAVTLAQGGIFYVAAVFTLRRSGV